MKKPSRLCTAVLALWLGSPALVPSTAEAAQPRPAAPSPVAQPELARAVRERRVVMFTYDGRPRVVEPHAYGLGGDGVPVMHGYQTGGESVSGGLPGWRTFRVAAITELRVGDDRFASARPDYVEGRPRLDPVWADVSARP